MCCWEGGGGGGEIPKGGRAGRARSLGIWPRGGEITGGGRSSKECKFYKEPHLSDNVYSYQGRASRRAFFYVRNPNYSEHSVPTILIPEL